MESKISTALVVFQSSFQRVVRATPGLLLWLLGLTIVFTHMYAGTRGLIDEAKYGTTLSLAMSEIDTQVSLKSAIMSDLEKTRGELRDAQTVLLKANQQLNTVVAINIANDKARLIAEQQYVKEYSKGCIDKLQDTKGYAAIADAGNSIRTTSVNAFAATKGYVKGLFR